MYDAYRPGTWEAPISPENRFLRLHAAFNARDPAFGQASAFGRPAWYGVFDSAYTRPGDYLVGPGGIFFIAAQEHLLPPLCVLTNAVISITRTAGAALPGLQDYGGATFAGDVTAVLTSWPASVLAARPGGHAALPMDGRPGNWTVLLPPGPTMVRTSDVITDDAQHTFVIDTAERSHLGTRIVATQAAA